MIPASRRISGLLGLISALILTILLGSCSRLLGWGVLLWSSEDPPVPSGTVLPVYIRSNINQVWVAGIPEAFRQGGQPVNKFEVPLAQLDLAKNKKLAREYAAAFAELALSYAETLQDGLPIREDPDNSSRRVYRLKLGEIIKILERVEGNPAISAAGTPLPGDWYRVLTEDGSRGYCFSYRLRIFEHSGGPFMMVQTAQEEEEDPELERLLSKTWSAEWYGTMVNSGQVNLEDLLRRWHFSPGIDTGIARIYLPSLDRSFVYTGIRPAGTRTWRFEGAPLQMTLRSDTTLEVQYTEEGRTARNLLFVALPSAVNDLIAQETTRREELYNQLYTRGPVFNSANYGALSFREDGGFTWTGYERLVPRIIPASVSGRGRVSLDLFVDSVLEDRAGGALSLIFDGIGNAGTVVRFLYTLDAQGFRLEYVPEANVREVTVTRRESSPTVIYFFRADPAGARTGWSSSPAPAPEAPPAVPAPVPSPGSGLREAPEPPRLELPRLEMPGLDPREAGDFDTPLSPDLPDGDPEP